MKLFKTNIFGETIEGETGKGCFGEDIYDQREWRPDPPPVAVGKVARIDNCEWVLHDDIRGTYYDKETAKEVLVDIPFVDTLEGVTGIRYDCLTDKKPKCDHPKWSIDKWIVDTEKKAEEKNRLLKQADEDLIYKEIRKVAIERLGEELKVVTE